MLTRTLEISREPTHLSVENRQLLITPQGENPRGLPMRRRIPCEDIGVLIVDERDTTYTHSALVSLMNAGAAVVVCGRDHMPAGIMLPVSSHGEQLWRLDAQLSMRKPVGKRLWADIIKAKIRAQAANLDHATAAQRRLLALAREVRSDDAGGAEATAARAYWSALFAGLDLPDGKFKRLPGDRASPTPNNLLDYGYAVMRAAVARALIGAGLFPAIGIQHSNRSNAFALADDLVEPLRPIVDAQVLRLVQERQFVLDRATKAELLVLISTPVQVEDAVGPLQAALPRYTTSLVRCLTGEAKELMIPVRAGSPPEVRSFAGGLDEPRDNPDEGGRA